MTPDALLAMLAKGHDNSLLRFGLGKALLDNEQAEQAVEHLLRCLEHDRNYSAAWKLLGKAYLDQGQTEQAKATWQQGIAIAQGKGDKQAEKEMQVFLRRLEKASGTTTE